MALSDSGRSKFGDRRNLLLIVKARDVRGDAKLPTLRVGESPAGGNCPVTMVVTSGNGEDDQAVEHPK